jgi:hypothetical protein
LQGDVDPTRERSAPAVEHSAPLYATPCANLDFFSIPNSGPPTRSENGNFILTLNLIKKSWYKSFILYVCFCDKNQFLSIHTSSFCFSLTRRPPLFAESRVKSAEPVGSREISGKMARLGSRGSSAGHASESACAASLAALAGADFSQGSGDDLGANRRPGISGHTLREHFHLPLHTVALKFGMCTTAFKKMCRRMGIAKWPHRQVWLIRPPPMRGASRVRRST